jgi:hypothetical protein
VSNAVTTGLFALGGVLIGGGLNIAGAYSLERRTRRRAARTAARLVLIEVSEAGHLLLAAQHQQTWEPLADLKLTDWQEHRGLLAGAMEGDDWLKAWMAERILQEFAAKAPVPFELGDEERAQEAALVVGRFTNVLIDISVDGVRWRRVRRRRRLRARLPKPLRRKSPFEAP